MKWDSHVWDLTSPLLKWSLYLPLFCGADSRHGTSGSETKNLVTHVSASRMGSSLLTSFVPTSTGVELCVRWVPLGGKVDTEFFYQAVSKPPLCSKLLLRQQSKLPYQPWETAWVEYIQSLEVSTPIKRSSSPRIAEEWLLSDRVIHRSTQGGTSFWGSIRLFHWAGKCLLSPKTC